MIPGKMVPGMGGAMDLVTGAKRVVVANAAHRKGQAKVHAAADLHKARGLVVSELAVIGFPDGRATLLERGPGVSGEQVIAGTEAKLVLPSQIPEMRF